MKSDCDLSVIIGRSLQLENISEFQDNNNEARMMNSSPECDVNNSSQVYSDSGYLTNFNQESRSLSMNSEVSSDDTSLPASKLTDSEGPCNVYFCENAVFDEPQLEGPPLVCEDSVTVGSCNISHTKYLARQICETTVPNIGCNSENSGGNLDDFVKIHGANNASDSTTNENCISFQMNISKGRDKSQSLRTVSQTCTDSSDATCCSLRSYSNCYMSAQDSSSTVNSLATTTDNCRSLLGQCTSNSVYDYAPSESSKTSTEDCLRNCTTPKKKMVNSVNPNLSPVLFSDEEEDEVSIPDSLVALPIASLGHVQKPVIVNEQVLKNDRKLLKRVQETLSGVPPPPSVTIIQITVMEMLNRIQNNKNLFSTGDMASCGPNADEATGCDTERQNFKSLLISNSKEDTDCHSWPGIINCRYHGLHYNRSKVSEDLELCCAKYANRYVGAETSSSCNVWSAALSNNAPNKRNTRLRWAGVKSPGRRLSHLAKRRITFSSSNLQASCSTMPVMGSATINTRHLMIDTRKTMLGGKRKSPKKSPWKKSPRKSPQKKVRTPVSSSKKRAARRLLLGGVEDESNVGSSRVSSTKRALFQSPDRIHNRSTTSSSTEVKILLQRPKSKRSLFISPTKKYSPAKKTISIAENKKRKRDEEEFQPNKFPRSLSLDVHDSRPSCSATAGVPPTRRHSEASATFSENVRIELSDLHKRKLLWAVSEALRSQQVGTSHPKFRTFASVLCKVVKHLMPDLFCCGPRHPGSTSDRMLKLAHQHAFAVTRGKTFEAVVQQARESTTNILNSKPPNGYVALDARKTEGKLPPPQQPANSRVFKIVLQDKIMNVEANQAGRGARSPESKSSGRADENSKARIRRQIIFDDNEILNKSCSNSR